MVTRVAATDPRLSMLHPLEPDDESEEDMRPYPFKSREFMLSEVRLNESNFVVKSDDRMPVEGVEGERM